MANINLVPEVKKEQAKIHQTNVMVTTTTVIIGSILLAIIILLGSLYGYRSARISTANHNITKINGELKVYADLEASVITLENGLADIKQITSGGRDWTEFFGEIEKAMPADTQFTSFKVTGNSVNATIKGKDVQSIDRFVKSFTGYKGKDDNNLFTGVTVDGYTSGSNDSVTFQAKFDIVGVAK